MCIYLKKKALLHSLEFNNTNLHVLLHVLPFFSPPVPSVSKSFGERVVVDFQLRYLLFKKHAC